MNADMWAVLVCLVLAALIAAGDQVAKGAEKRRRARQRAEAERLRMQPGEFEPDSWWW